MILFLHFKSNKDNGYKMTVILHVLNCYLNNSHVGNLERTCDKDRAIILQLAKLVQLLGSPSISIADTLTWSSLTQAYSPSLVASNVLV